MELYPIALDYGISPATFWGYSISDIKDLFESRRRTAEQEAKRRISDTYELAALIGLHVQRLFDADIKIPQKWDVYPELFEQERRYYEDHMQKEQLEEAKISRSEYARIYNQRRREQGIS